MTENVGRLVSGCVLDDTLGAVLEARALVHRLSVDACWGPAPVWRVLHHMEERLDAEIEGLLRAPVVEVACGRCGGQTERAGWLCLECQRIVGRAPFTRPERASQEPGAMLLPCGHRVDEHPDPACDGQAPADPRGSELNQELDPDLDSRARARADADAWADDGARELERVEARRLLADLDTRISGLHFDDEAPQ